MPSHELVDIGAGWQAARAKTGFRVFHLSCFRDDLSASLVWRTTWVLSVLTVAGLAAQQPAVTSSYGPTNQAVTFEQIKADRMAVKAARASAHADLLSSRYVLDVRTDPAVRMSAGKPLPVGPTAKITGAGAGEGSGPLPV